MELKNAILTVDKPRDEEKSSESDVDVACGAVHELDHRSLVPEFGM